MAGHRYRHPDRSRFQQVDPAGNARRCCRRVPCRGRRGATVAEIFRDAPGQSPRRGRSDPRPLTRYRLTAAMMFAVKFVSVPLVMLMSPAAETVSVKRPTRIRVAIIWIAVRRVI